MNRHVRFGLSGVRGGLEAPGPSSTLELARLAEELGFDCLWFNEEHFGRHHVAGGRPVLSPVVLATAVAAATSRLRVGFSVLLVPLHHPLRLAEEIATLDVLSNGRVNFGVSSANSPRYNPAFGYDRETGPSLADCLDQIIGYWNGVPITVEGVDHTVSPRPTQLPHPPVFVGAYRPESLEWAARAGFATIQHGIQSPASLQRCLATFAGAGGDISRVPVGRFCYVGDSDASAREDAWGVVVQQAHRLHEIGLWRRGDQITTEADLDPERFYHETAIVGGPQTVAERINQLHDEHGVSYVNLLSSFFGFMPEPLLRRSLQLFSEQVVPLVNGTGVASVTDENEDQFDLGQIEVGMDLCSRDFKKWGTISKVHQAGGGGQGLVIGTVDTSGQTVYVPVGEILELRGRCLRLTRELIQLDGAGFDRHPAGLG